MRTRGVPVCGQESLLSTALDSVSFCLPQKENIRQKFVEDLRKEFAGKGLTFSIGTICPRGSCWEVAVGQCALDLDSVHVQGS